MFKLNYNTEIEELKKEILILKADLEARDNIPTSLNERIADLEIKMSRLWNALMEVSPSTGKEKLTKLGRRFGGNSLR